MDRHRPRSSLARSTLVGALALAALAASGAPPAHADGLVVADGRGGPLQPGQTIDAGQVVKLTAGQRLTLIAANGAVIKLAGPFEGVPDPDGQRTGSVADSLLKLTSQTTQGTSTLGTVRGTEGAPPEPWLVAVASNGHRCVQEGRPVVFWRPAAPAEQVIEITPSDHSWEASATWPAGADKLTMPPNFPAQDDQAYIIGVGGATSTVTLHLMSPAFDRDAMQIAWMMEKGCVAQARVLAGGVK